ncbi:DUF6284 family protein [Streptomyces sp. NPDC051994]|uniref:DUF6284 family protein n=1 Tax=unclassified Streptomyces TaxID=2593676 RepID=UPI003432CF9A
MEIIAALQSAVMADLPDGEPSDAELDAIEIEMPLILAEVELLDVQISVMDRPFTDLSARRIRRARRRVLAARRDLTNLATFEVPGVAA